MEIRILAVRLFDQADDLTVAEVLTEFVPLREEWAVHLSNCI